MHAGARQSERAPGAVRSGPGAASVPIRVHRGSDVRRTGPNVSSATLTATTRSYGLRRHTNVRSYSTGTTLSISTTTATPVRTAVVHLDRRAGGTLPALD